MAKKEQEFSYGSSFLPEGEKKYSVIRWGWGGLNETDKIDTGQLTADSGMICDPPYMVPAHKYKELIRLGARVPYGTGYLSDANKHSGTPKNIAAFGSMLFLVWHDNAEEKMAVTKFVPIRDGDEHWDDFWIGSFQMGDAIIDDKEPRSIVLFNAVDTSSGNVAGYTYDKKVLVYPDCYSENAYAFPNYTEASSFDTLDNPIPYANYVTVFQSRVFGATDVAVHASANNSYVDYTLDDASDISTAHAWYSMAQSNPEANYTVTAVLTYDNHVVVFRKDFMQLVYNNKNPFRIVDVGEYGCDNYKSWTILNGVLYFASDRKVYAYTGGNPKEISTKMDFGDLSGAVLGSYKDRVWMQTNKSLYIYKDGTWSDIGLAAFGGADMKILQFSETDYGLVALADYHPGHDDSWGIILLDWDKEIIDPTTADASAWDPQYTGNWYFETDLMALGKLDVRRVKKFSMLCEGKTGAAVSVFLFQDDLPHTFDANDYKVGSLTFDGNGFKMLRVLTRQFSSTMHKLRFAGSGYVKIYAAELKISWGGDVYAEG